MFSLPKRASFITLMYLGFSASKLLQELLCRARIHSAETVPLDKLVLAKVCRQRKKKYMSTMKLAVRLTQRTAISKELRTLCH